MADMIKFKCGFCEDKTGKDFDLDNPEDTAEMVKWLKWHNAVGGTYQPILLPNLTQPEKT